MWFFGVVARFISLERVDGAAAIQSLRAPQKSAQKRQKSLATPEDMAPHISLAPEC
jgi:hypothetical protein